MEDVLISWSGGKDSCLALYELQQAGEHRAAALLTTVTRDYDRVQMHGVRRVLLERQAASLGLPLHQVLITKGATNEEYERAMAGAFSGYREQGINAVVFGDLFLADVRAYREQFLARHGMRGLYPVWMRDTGEFVREFIALGFKAVVTCVSGAALDGASRFLGAKHVRSYLGLVPREYSSGKRQCCGRISKAGSVRARALLVEAAWAVLRWKTERTRALHEWWARIVQRRGKPTAVVALARKLAGIMFAVWRDGTEFDPLRLRPGGAPKPAEV
jgi:uncharacterized protein (TIGR00290 family)